MPRPLLILPSLVVVLAVASTAASEPLPTLDLAKPRIAFTSTRDGTSEIYVMNADGSEQRRLTVNPAHDVSPAWSPDGTRIAFASNRAFGNWDIYVIDATGGGLQRLTTSQGSDVTPSWSPDGTEIAFASTRDGNSEIYVMNADGSEPVRLTSNPAEDSSPSFAPSTPQCAADAGAIAFESNRDDDYDIYVLSTDATEIRNITDNDLEDFNPAWAPDCSAIAFDRPISGNYDVFVKALPVGTENRITTGPDEDSRPAWSPDGDAISFTSLGDGQYEIYVASVDGTTANVSNSFPSSDAEPAWMPLMDAPSTRPGPASDVAPWRSLRAYRISVRRAALQLTCGSDMGPRAGSRILGTNSADVICSDDHGQILDGRRGRDTIHDAGGRDKIYGGRERDVIYARDGARDVVTGGPGADEIYVDRFDEVRKATGDAVTR
jgi:dipeptidyl aminopeptidase/acylaminoacyl peptidase